MLYSRYDKLNKGCRMSIDHSLRIVGILIFSSALLIGPAGRAHGQAGAVTTPAQTVKGDVLDIEGEYYIVKDITGHEIRLHVNQETKMEDRIKVGDKIEAHINSDGHASAIKVQVPDAAPSKTPPSMLP
jgi:hypothetical protein